MSPFDRAHTTSYWRSIVTTALSRVVSEIFNVEKCRDLEIRVMGSLKVIGTDTYRSDIYDFHSNHGPVSYRFKDKRRFQSKIAKFYHPVYFAPMLKEFPLELGTGAGGQKNSDGATMADKEVWWYLRRLDTIHQRDRDRQADRNTGRQQRPRLRTASRGKNQLISGHFNAEIDRMANGWETLITLSRCRSMWICGCVCVQLYLHDKTKTMIGMTCNSAQ